MEAPAAETPVSLSVTNPGPLCLPAVSLRWGPERDRQAGLRGRRERRHVLRRRPPAGRRADLRGRAGDHGYVEWGGGGAPRASSDAPTVPCPAGLWLGMLACVFLAAAAFVTYTACMDWKRAAEEVSAAPPKRQGRASTSPVMETVRCQRRPFRVPPQTHKGNLSSPTAKGQTKANGSVKLV